MVGKAVYYVIIPVFFILCPGLLVAFEFVQLYFAQKSSILLESLGVIHLGQIALTLYYCFLAAFTDPGVIMRARFICHDKEVAEMAIPKAT